jgi:hypothetical protein
MATWSDVERIATGLPGVVESPSYDGWRSWKVGTKNVVWERPLRGRDLADLEATGRAAPTGVTIGVRVADLDEKDVRIAEHPDVVFTVPHLDGYAAVLVVLDEIDVDDLEELVTAAWIHQAPKRVVKTWQEAR